MTHHGSRSSSSSRLPPFCHVRASPINVSFVSDSSGPTLPTADWMDQLHFAAGDGHNVEDIRKLLEQHRDVNARNAHGCTALHTAACCGHLDVMVEQGADCHIKSNGGKTARDMARDAGKTQVVMMLGLPINHVEVRHGKLVDSIALHNSSGLAASCGGTGGNRSFFSLDDTENIVQIVVWSGGSVDSILFRTNTGAVHGPYGGPGGSPHTLTAPRNQCLKGMFVTDHNEWFLLGPQVIKEFKPVWGPIP
mmetsp:Transcript_11195/g.26074  ORF Transcript_11195/g.26074 Transcript_11195/m.26074 type:complete len:250 (+) Transcript_11195:141-890(+)